MKFLVFALSLSGCGMVADPPSVELDGTQEQAARMILDRLGHGTAAPQIDGVLTNCTTVGPVGPGFRDGGDCVSTIARRSNALVPGQIFLTVYPGALYSLELPAALEYYTTGGDLSAECQADIQAYMADFPEIDIVKTKNKEEKK